MENIYFLVDEFLEEMGTNLYRCLFVAPLRAVLQSSDYVGNNVDN